MSYNRSALADLDPISSLEAKGALTESQPSITGTTHTLPFDKLSPLEFERMCLWLVEREGYERAEHLGAAGSDQGLDIVAWRGDERWGFQCKRVQSFAFPPCTFCGGC